MQLTYSKVVQILAEMNDIASDSEGAFRARLRHFQRLGFPKGSNTGKGTSAKYDLEMVLQLVLAMEFMQAGVTPARIVELVTKNWLDARSHMLLAVLPHGTYVHSKTREPVDPDMALCVSPEALRELTKLGEGEFDYFEAFHFQEVKALAELFNDEEFHPLLGTYWRWIIILIRPLMFVFLGKLHQVAEIEIVDAVEHLREIIEQYNKSLDEASRFLDAGGERDGNP